MNAPHPSNTLTAADPIKRAYEYLNQVRAQLLNNREVYDRFLEVMGRFKEQRWVFSFFLCHFMPFFGWCWSDVFLFLFIFITSFACQFRAFGSDGACCGVICRTPSTTQWFQSIPSERLSTRTFRWSITLKPRRYHNSGRSSRMSKLAGGHMSLRPPIMGISGPRRMLPPPYLQPHHHSHRFPRTFLGYLPREAESSILTEHHR